MSVSMSAIVRSFFFLVALATGLLMTTPAQAQKKAPPKKTPATNKKTTPAKPQPKPAPPKKTPVATPKPAPNLAALPADKLASYQARVRELVENMESQFNILASGEYDLAEKSTVINEAYLDVYRDDKVQIEDDLVDNRSTVYNKNIKSYLQDIATFYGQAQFKLEVSKIEQLTTEAGQLAFKATLNRNLSGTTKDGLPVNKTVKRFVEVNLVDRAKDELKVASVYTSGVAGVAGMQFWWAALPPEWKGQLAPLMGLADTVATDEQLKLLTESTQRLDFKNQPQLTDLAPLGAFKNLQQLDISNTAVEDLGPLRDLLKLNSLHLGNTRVMSLEPLAFLVSITELNATGVKLLDAKPLANLVNLERLSLAGALVRDLKPLAGLAKLQDLNLTGLPAEDLAPLAELRQLRTLNLSGTRAAQLAPLRNLAELQTLVLDNTPVKNVDDLRGLAKLATLSLNDTDVASLAGLGSLPALKTLLADNSELKRKEALAFMAANPQCALVFETAALQKWWQSTPPAWRTVLLKAAQLNNPNPGKEELARLSNLTELNVAGNKEIASLAPLLALPELTKLVARETPVADAITLSRLPKLRYIDLANTKVTDLTNWHLLPDLEEVNIENSPVSSFLGLEKADKLKVLYADGTLLAQNSKAVVGWIESRPHTLLVYRTEALQNWWKGLDRNWQTVLGKQIPASGLAAGAPTREGLHQLALIKTLKISDIGVNSLQPITLLYRLEELEFSKTQINDLTPVTLLPRLAVLRLPNNPIGDLSPLAGMASLRVLDISSTAVEDLAPLHGLTGLRELNFSGTQVKKLDREFAQMTGLERIECYSTALRSLKPVESLPKLKFISCYNTKLSSGDMKSFRQAQPKCEVVHY